jgi:ribosomal protein S10
MNSVNNQIKTQVKLESFDHRLLTIACKRLVEGIISINGLAKGPIALPTKKTNLLCITFSTCG